MRRTPLSAIPSTRIASACCMLAGLVCAASQAQTETRVVDPFDGSLAWTVIATEGVQAKVRLVNGHDGQAMRLEFNFESGAGFCVVRREINLDLPENYRFLFYVRGDAPDNNLEFKLFDESGENVWWVNRRAFSFPKQWQRLVQKKRHIDFAWGPNGGAPLKHISAIEFAIAASSGGKGYVDIDQLELAELPVPQPLSQPPRVAFSSGGDSMALDEAGSVNWHSAADDAQPALTIDFGQFHEFGGLMIDWDRDDYAIDYTVSISTDGREWESAATIEGSTGGRDYIPLPDAEAASLRVDVLESSGSSGIGVRNVQVMDVDFAESPNAMYARIAQQSPRGWFPQYFLGEQEPWTIVGVIGDDDEALIGANGAIEIDKASVRLEPFLLLDGKMITWADVTPRQSLAADYLPIPSVTWETPKVTLDVTALATGNAGTSELVAHYNVRNRSDAPVAGTLFIAVRPFQVLPPWQDLNVVGGVSRTESLTWQNGAILIGTDKVIRPWSSPDSFGAATFAQGDAVEYISRNVLPPADAVNDPAGLASGVLRYDFELAPGAEQVITLGAPFHGTEFAKLRRFSSAAAAQRQYERVLKRVSTDWQGRLNRVQIELPPAEKRIFDTFRSTQAYILINADGPSIQPGSRTYERSWIRDGALTSTALLYTGQYDRVRKFIEWYAPNQYENGKVPCVVDRRGPDPVPEHDSTGELIYLLLKYYRFTHDRELLEENLPRVVAGVDYIESLRNQRMTDEYRNGPPEKRACYGLVPESISHEGYSAKPMHSYWDSFFTLCGLEDATEIARILERPELEQRFAQLTDEYRTALYDSIRLAMQTKQIDYIPGCVELGDFDATSTAIGVFPCGQYGQAPEPAMTNTFERYYKFFTDRRDDKIEWDAYTPYEIRLVGTFVHLGQPQRAHALLDFFFDDQFPHGWNHWAEVVWHDPQTPKFIGDMPHTWVGSAYINAVRNMFVYEDEQAQTLLLAQGVKPEWLSAGGVTVKNLPTEYGTFSYRLTCDGNKLVLDVEGDGTVPPGGLLFKNPLLTPIRNVHVNRGGAEITDGNVRLLDCSSVRAIMVMDE